MRTAIVQGFAQLGSDLLVDFDLVRRATSEAQATTAPFVHEAKRHVYQ